MQKPFHEQVVAEGEMARSLLGEGWHMLEVEKPNIPLSLYKTFMSGQVFRQGQLMHSSEHLPKRLRGPEWPFQELWLCRRGQYCAMIGQMKGPSMRRYIAVADQRMFRRTDEEKHNIAVEWANWIGWERALRLYQRAHYAMASLSGKGYGSNELLRLAEENGWGMWLTSQDPFEALITFIISQRNTIPKIGDSLNKLCTMYGKCYVVFGSAYFGETDDADGAKPVKYYGFPSLDTLAREKLGGAGLGYRAEYIRGSCQTIKTLAHQGDGEAYLRRFADTVTNQSIAGTDCTFVLHGMLEKLPGVGPKVAACAGLFGFGNDFEFPVDIWIERGFDYMQMVNPKWWERLNVNREMITNGTVFGPANGYVQQMLYNYIISHKNYFK